MKSITIHAGHNPHGKIGSGASDYINESTENRIILNKVKELLKGKVNFTDVTVNNGKSQNDILKKIVSSCNKLKRDYDISIHFNACYHSESDCKTKGVECWIYDKKNPTKKLGDLICKNISSIGFKNRGVKESKSLYFIKNTDKPAIIIEVCFVDDFDDVKLYKKNKDKVAEAIANAIIECCK